MAGDYTRFTFTPRKDYSGIFQQQGRVDLDADFNELIEIIDRRWRSETIDIIDHCVVPNTTPDAFLIAPTGVDTFDIGIGRMYVDGLQAENHGRPPLDYQADLGEPRGTSPIPYADQPYLPAPLPPVLAPAPNSTDLVYLEVWQRELTVIEDPSLREIALGGPDTTTRIQTVWQVRVLEDVGQHGCGDDIAAWDSLIAPSAGRLTTSAVAPPASDDPCIIAPSGGYRGLENRLYRVEIHATGGIGGMTPAQFKWSRNNASIASTVSAIPSASQVTVQRVGRDQVLRFEVGNWIEITDDFREFQSLAGHIAQITALDEANRILDFAPAIPVSFTFDPTDPDRHTRVRRWDQSQNLNANGLLDVTAGLIDIEDGIQVGFDLDPAGGQFRIGDYWVFAARTADGSVEPLQDAPPRGILHHYCRLGFLHWGDPLGTPTFTDCRVHWPPLGDCGCCTVTVGDGIDSHGQFTDIQQAIDALGNRGGVVCIGRGFYTVTAGLVINSNQRNIIIRGMGPATRILFDPPQGAAGAFLSLNGTEHIRLEQVFVVSTDAEALVRINGARFCRIEDCTLVNLAGRGSELTPAPRAIEFVEDSSHCEIVHNALLSIKAITANSGQVRELQIRDNQILALEVSVFITQGFGIEIVHNQMRGLGRESLSALLDTPISRGTIDAFQQSVSNAFRSTPAFANFQAAGVMIFIGNRVVITQNLITAQVAVFGFLFLNARIHQNDIVALVGTVNLFGIRVKMEDNFVFGLFAGLIQTGISLDLDCTANEWLGLNGIVWISLGEVAQAVGLLLGTALESAGFTANGQFAVNNTLAQSPPLVGDFPVFALALLAKIHRNVFLNFSRGIYKTDRVISADIAIVDNSFSFCAEAGIELGGGGRNTYFLLALLRVINLRHWIQGNALAVPGRGIVSSNILTQVEQNSVQCPRVAVELDAGSCTVRRNSLLGIPVERSSLPEEGLIILNGSATQTRVSGNHLFNAASHGILIREDLERITIEDNHIEVARRFGIGTFSDTTALSSSSLSGNRVQGCVGDTPAGSLQFGGAIVIGEGRDLRLIDNVVVDNTPLAPGDQFLRWYAVYLEDADGVEISGNTITGNAGLQGLGGALGAVGLQGARGVIRIQNNVVRNNGGVALAVGEGRDIPEQVQHALIQNNHFSAGPNPGSFLVWVNAIDSLLFQGNECLGAITNLPNLPAGAAIVVAPITLLAGRANVSANLVDFTANDQTVMAVTGVDLVVSANSVRFGTLRVAGSPVTPTFFVRVIVTSNLTTGLFATSTGTLIRANNFPPP